MIKNYHSIKKDIIILEQQLTLIKNNSNDSDSITNTQSVVNNNENHDEFKNEIDIEGLKLITCEKTIKEFRKLSED